MYSSCIEHSHPANGGDVSSRRWRLAQKAWDDRRTCASHHIYNYIHNIIIHVYNNMSFCRIARQITNANAWGSDEIFLMEGGRWIHTKLYIMHNSFIILFIILRHTMQRFYTYTHAYSSHLNTIYTKVVTILSKDDGPSYTDNVRIFGGKRIFSRSRTFIKVVQTVIKYVYYF